ncbi:hypothetical protein D3C86_1701150 [compost metagenome]
MAFDLLLALPDANSPDVDDIRLAVGRLIFKVLGPIASGEDEAVQLRSSEELPAQEALEQVHTGGI